MMTPPPKATSGTTAATIHGDVVSSGTIRPSPYTHRPACMTRARPTRSASLPEAGDEGHASRGAAEQRLRALRAPGDLVVDHVRVERAIRLVRDVVGDKERRH